MSSGGKEICSQPALQEFFQDVELALTEEAMWSLDHFLQIHAAAAQVSGQKAVVLIGDHGAGKTTLVVTLARLGARIFTDEVALLDPVRLELTPFRRDLILHTETQALFPDLSRGPEAPEFKRFAEYRYVSPKAIDTQNSPEPSALGSMLFPRLQPGSAVSCSPVGPRMRLGDCWPIRSIWVLSRKSVPMSRVGWWRTVRRWNECSATLGKLQRGFCPQ
mgnify:CR=1 FL=1